MSLLVNTKNNINILVTGGAGYIGSHTVRELQRAGFGVVVVDNLSTGHAESVPCDVPFVQCDIRDRDQITTVLNEYQIQAVVHFAANSLVAESMQDPAKYYNNNVVATLSLLETMRQCGVNHVVFSSTAAVYGEPAMWPIGENSPTNPTNVYGRTKLVIEGMLSDFAAAYGLAFIALRYFNAAGALAGGGVGEDHSPESHLIPLVLKAAQGQRQAIDMYGTDYPTPDGTCVRDYIHVTDLSTAHVLAVQRLLEGGESGVYNVGSETGYTVRHVIEKARALTGLDFPVREVARRAGDPAVLVASSSKIRQELGWQPSQSDLESIIRTAWAWHSNYPNGFKQG